MYKEKPVLKGFADMKKCGVASAVSNPSSRGSRRVLNKELGKAMYGEQTADEALDNAAEQGGGDLRPLTSASVACDM